MLRPRILVAAVLAASVLDAHGQGAPVPVRDPDTALQLRGFRIKPPPGKDWYVAKKDDRGVLFLKKTGDRFHSFYMRASAEPMHPDLTSPDELLKAMKTEFDSGAPGGPRHQPRSFEYAADEMLAPGCFRYSLSSGDTKVPGAGGKVLEMDIVGYVCAHPESPRTVVEIMYSERGGPRPESATYRKEAEDFIRGLVFTPVP